MQEATQLQSVSAGVKDQATLLDKLRRLVLSG